MHAWLQSLTRPEDPLLWSWIGIVAGYTVIGLILGRHHRSMDALTSDPASDPASEPAPPPSSR